MAGMAKILCGLLWAQLLFPCPGWSAEVGEPIPDFGMQTLAGAPVSRASLTGKPLLLVFWNTWCANCKRELPRVNSVAQKFAPELRVLAVNTALNDSEEKARAYLKKYGYLFPAGFDRSFQLGQAFHIVGVPTVILVDPQGIVRYKGATLPDDIEARLRPFAKK